MTIQPIDRLSLREQLVIFDETVELAFDHCLQEMVEDRELIIAAARERLISGSREYGDQRFHASPEQLKRERREEYADAVNYRVMQR